MNLRKLTPALAFAGGLLLAGQANALFLDKRPNGGPFIEIDDMDFEESVVVEDSTPNGMAVTSDVRGIGGSGVWVNADGTRQGGDNALYVNLIAGDVATTEDCSNCRVSHTTSTSAVAHHFFTFRGEILTANVGDLVGFNYETDTDHADIFLTFNLDGVKVGDQFQWGDLAATGLSVPPPRPLCCILEDTITEDFRFNSIRIDVISDEGLFDDPWLGMVDVGSAAVGLDTNIADNIPEPASLALLGLGMLGLGWQRRRARA